MSAPCSSTAAMRKFVPPRSTPIENLFMMNDSVVGSRESRPFLQCGYQPVNIKSFYQSCPSQKPACIRVCPNPLGAIFDNLNSSDCCVRPGPRAGSWFCTPDTAPLLGHKLDAEAGRTLLLHRRPRNRKSKIHPKRSLRAALPAPLGAAFPSFPV